MYREIKPYFAFFQVDLVETSDAKFARVRQPNTSRVDGCLVMDLFVNQDDPIPALTKIITPEELSTFRTTLPSRQKLGI